MAALEAALRDCAPQLTSLTLRLVISLHIHCWDITTTVAAMPRLQSLVVTSNASLRVSHSLAALTAMKHLELYPEACTQLELCAALPPTLTSLGLRATGRRHAREGALPSQVCMVPASCALLRPQTAALP
jgi:hypothetical protein